MYKSLILSLIVVCGCSSNSATQEDAGLVSDLIVDAGPICCQITENATPDPHWQNGFYACNDAAVTRANIPWICGNNMSCFDPQCVVGRKCLGFNGNGIVVSCSFPIVPDGG